MRTSRLSPLLALLWILPLAVLAEPALSQPLICPSSRNACAYYYVIALDGQCGALYIDATDFDLLMTYWDPIDPWEYDPNVQYRITDSPNLTLEHFVRDANGAGLIDIDTHGSREDFILECYATSGACEDAYNAYLGGEYNYEQIGWDWSDEFGAYVIWLTNTGLEQKITQKDPLAYIYAGYCYSCDAARSWEPYGLFVGATGDGVNCSVRLEIYQAICCGSEYSRFQPMASLVLHLYDWESIGMDWHGNMWWSLTCGASCTLTTAMFEGAGACGATVWAVTNSEVGVDSMRVMGYRRASDWPDGPVAVAAQAAAGGYGKRRFYRFDAPELSEYALLEVWAGGGGCSARSYSGPFPVSPASPDFGTLERINASAPAPHPPPLVAHTSFDRATEIAFSRDGARPLAESGSREQLDGPPDRGAHVLAYSTLESFLEPVATYYEGRMVEGVSLHLRNVLGDGTVEDVRAAIADLVATNRAWNAYCAEHPEECEGVTYPEVPYLLLVGDCNPAFVETYYFPDSYSRCGAPQCASDALIADLDGDWLEDAIVIRIPCMSVEEVNHLLLSTDRYVGQFFKKGIMLVGAYNHDGDDARPRRIIGLYDSILEYMRHGRVWLVEKNYGYSPGTYDPYADIKEQAFVDEVNRGVGWIIGWDYETSWATWPGRFLTHVDFDINRLSKKQTAVAILPGCLMGSEQLDDATEHDGYPTKIHQLLFRDPNTGTSLACGISHMNAAWDVQHELWAEVLASEVSLAPTGRTWARIVRDAKVTFRTLYPDLYDDTWREFLASVSVQGTLVGKPGPGREFHGQKGPYLPMEDGEGHALSPDPRVTRA